MIWWRFGTQNLCFVKHSMLYIAYPFKASWFIPETHQFHFLAPNIKIKMFCFLCVFLFFFVSFLFLFYIKWACSYFFNAGFFPLLQRFIKIIIYFDRQKSDPAGISELSILDKLLKSYDRRALPNAHLGKSF